MRGGGLFVDAFYAEKAGAEGDINAHFQKAIGEAKWWVDMALATWIGNNQDFPVACHYRLGR